MFTNQNTTPIYIYISLRKNKTGHIRIFCPDGITPNFGLLWPNIYSYIYVFAYLYNIGWLEISWKSWGFIYESNWLRNCIFDIFGGKRFPKWFQVLILQIFRVKSNIAVCEVSRSTKIARMCWLNNKHKNTDKNDSFRSLFFAQKSTHFCIEISRVPIYIYIYIHIY